MGSLFSKPKVKTPAPPPPPPEPPETDVTDPDAVSNSRKRALQEAARRGRSSLRIPLSTAKGGAGGVSIPS